MESRKLFSSTVRLSGTLCIPAALEPRAPREPDHESSKVLAQEGLPQHLEDLSREITACVAILVERTICAICLENELPELKNAPVRQKVATRIYCLAEHKKKYRSLWLYYELYHLVHGLDWPNILTPQSSLHAPGYLKLCNKMQQMPDTSLNLV